MTHCKNCLHEEACAAWIHHGEILYDDFEYSVDNCPHYACVIHGHWKRKRHKIFGNNYDYVCSVCGCDYALAEYVYCPNCGAKMDGDQNGESN